MYMLELWNPNVLEEWNHDGILTSAAMAMARAAIFHVPSPTVPPTQS